MERVRMRRATCTVRSGDIYDLCVFGRKGFVCLGIAEEVLVVGSWKVGRGGNIWELQREESGWGSGILG